MNTRAPGASLGVRSMLAGGLLSASLLASAAGETAGEVGGAGKLIHGLTCFKSGSKKVPIVCGEPVVHYKVTTLMGDPLGHFGVSWNVDSFHIADADSQRSENYLAGSVPRPIWEARKSVELSLYGFARVRSPNATNQVTALPFDTGVGVKATGELSLNVPSGYNWDRFLVVDSPGSGPAWACSDKSRPAEPQEAKKLMRSGFELYGLHICPRTSINVEALERAIIDWCESRPDNRAKYCAQKDKEEQAPPKKSNADPFAALDKPSSTAPPTTANRDPFAVLDEGRARDGSSTASNMDAVLDRAEAARVAAVERQRRHDLAKSACEQDLARQDRCSKDSCGREPDAEQCVREIREVGSCPPSVTGNPCILIPTFTCVERGPNPAHAVWKSCLRDKAAQCAAGGRKIISVSSCVSERMADQK